MTQSYRVLARKYRPQQFADLVGQDNLVTLLQNAIRLNRVPHALILTGVRGVGKTTTARIMAKAVNCIGTDQTQQQAAIEPCNACEHCVDITNDRHLDVLEVDAASRTGVDNIRELIDSIKYRPVRARTKIYIIDEVHMLSTPAFNALLKTLEEPPPNVMFIFATTDVHKIPITVRSRCQRIDLSRVPISILRPFLQKICQQESITITENASKLIALSAEGSVRDSLSLLDQAMAMTQNTHIDEQLVGQMLGLSDNQALLNLMSHLFNADVKMAPNTFADLYSKGVDPIMLAQEMLRLVHLLSRATCRDSDALNEQELEFFNNFANQLSVPALTRAWQILLKGHDEIINSPYPDRAMEMILIRLCYVTDILSDETIKKKV